MLEQKNVMSPTLRATLHFLFDGKQSKTAVPLFLPESGHILQSLSLGLRDKFPHKERCQNTDNTVKAVCERMTEILHGTETHVVERQECG